MADWPVWLQAVVWSLAVAVGLVGSAIFSGLETGTYVLNKMRMELRASHGDGRARRWHDLLSRPQEMLGTLLVANNAVNYMVTAGAVGLLTLADTRQQELLTTLLVTPTIFVLGEIVPKNLFRLAAERLVYPLGGLLLSTRLLVRWTGLGPLVTGFATLTLRLWQRGGRGRLIEPRQRVQALLAEGHAHGALSLAQSRMASRVMRTGETTIREVMVPLSRVVSIPADCSRERFVQTLAGHEFSRLPAWQGQPDRVVGILNIYDVLYDEDPSARPAQHLRPPVVMQPDWDLARALVTLQRAHRAMGLVVDGKGRALGIVTMKDLVEEIVGELEAW